MPGTLSCRIFYCLYQGISKTLVYTQKRAERRTLSRTASLCSTCVVIIHDADGHQGDDALEPIAADSTLHGH